MLCPDFLLSQTNTEVVIEIRVPMCSLYEAEISILDNILIFHAKPYYLRLTIPGDVENESSEDTAKYDSETETIVVRAKKCTEGEYFKDLNMITSLLAAPSKKTMTSDHLIQVLESNESQADDNDGLDEIDWFIEQKPISSSDDNISFVSSKYGFGRTKENVFKTDKNDLLEVVQIKDPDHIPLSERSSMQESMEEEQFDPDHYLADFYDNSLANEIIQFRPQWMDDYKKLREGIPVDDIVKFDDEERFTLKSLPRKEYLIDKDILPSIYLGMVDILFAYAYDMRITSDEHCVESPWNITKLSSTLSWFNEHSNLRDCLRSSFRRALSYPLCRSWKVCQKLKKDVMALLALGKTKILQCFLDIRKIFINRDGYDILNRLYITDYCVWIQTANTTTLMSLYEHLNRVTLTKDEIGLNLCEWEKKSAEARTDEHLLT